MITYAQNASRLHKAVGEILTTTSPWKGFSPTQEVLVSDLFPSFTGRERYDWVIKDLFVIIEAHGIQHYKVQSFGQDASEALMNFELQKTRDSQKEEVAALHNWTYLIIPYTDEKKLDAKYLMELYNARMVKTLPVRVEQKPEPDEYHKAQLEKAKAYRREQYERAKAYKKTLGK